MKNINQLTDRDVYIWMQKYVRCDTRWGFGIAEINREDWIIGYRAGFSFPMFKLEGVKDIEEAFYKFLDGNGWQIIEWLCGNPDEEFRKAADRLERGGEGVVRGEIWPD